MYWREPAAIYCYAVLNFGTHIQIPKSAEDGRAASTKLSLNDKPSVDAYFPANAVPFQAWHLPV
jgi:hypothetical protein